MSKQGFRCYITRVGKVIWEAVTWLCAVGVWMLTMWVCEGGSEGRSGDSGDWGGVGGMQGMTGLNIHNEDHAGRR